MSATAQLKKLKLANRELQQFQQNVDDAVRPLLANPLANSVLAYYTTQAVMSGNSDFVIVHTLGRNYVGVVALVPSAAAFAAGGSAMSPALMPTMGAPFAFYLSPTVNMNQSTQIIMRCTGSLASGTKLGFLVF